MGGMLDGLVVVGPVAAGPLLGGKTADEPGRDPLAECAENPGLLSTDPTGKRVAFAPDWYGQSAMGDLLGEDNEVIPYQNLYRCLDKLVQHKEGLFSFLKQRWQDMFNVGFDVLLYDLTSTYFECDPPGHGKRSMATAATSVSIACKS